MVRDKPEIVAPDGTNTTFFGAPDPPCCEGDGFPNFFGTSAAAPHAAAVAALLLEAAPGLSPDDVYAALETTAIDMDDPFTPGFDVGFDFGTGNGLIQADLAIASTNNPPEAILSSAPNVGEPEIGASSYSFTIDYSDNSAIDVSTIGTSDVSISGPGAMAITTATPDDLSDGTPRLVTCTATPPSGAWDSGDNGTYTITMNGSEVGDDGAPQLFVPAGTLGTFDVAADNTAPFVSDSLAEDVIFSDFGDTIYTFTIEYSDVGGIDVSSIGTSDVTVRDPSLTPLTVTGATVPSGNGSPKMATYTVTPPGGSWDATDAGTYTIELNASEVLDVLGASVPGANPLTTFDVADSPSISISDVTSSEGDSGSTAFDFAVTLSQSSVETVTVDFTTNDGTAVDTSDYNAVSGTITFVPADTSEIISVQVNGDTTVELDETFTVDLSSPTNATILDSQGDGTIPNDDAANFSIDDVSLAEGDTGATSFDFTVTLDNDVDTAVSVDFDTNDGSAIAASTDYTADSGTLSFVGNAGETMGVSVLVNGDTTVELDEGFTLDLSNVVASGRNVGISDSQGAGTILNDDAADSPSISISDVTSSEGDSGSTAFDFAVTLSQSSLETVTVDFTTTTAQRWTPLTTTPSQVPSPSCQQTQAR